MKARKEKLCLRRSKAILVFVGPDAEWLFALNVKNGHFDEGTNLLSFEGTSTIRHALTKRDVKRALRELAFG